MFYEDKLVNTYFSKIVKRGEPIYWWNKDGLHVLNNLTLNGNKIIDSDSNSNGEWIKFSDGTMICKNDVVLSNLTFKKATATSVVAQTISGNDLGNYPQNFTDLPTLFVDCITGPFMKPLDLYNRSVSHVGQCYLWTWNETTNVAGTISYLAIGRWK